MNKSINVALVIAIIAVVLVATAIATTAITTTNQAFAVKKSNKNCDPAYDGKGHGYGNDGHEVHGNCQ